MVGSVRLMWWCGCRGSSEVKLFFWKVVGVEIGGYENSGRGGRKKEESSEVNRGNGVIEMRLCRKQLVKICDCVERCRGGRSA